MYSWPLESTLPQYPIRINSHPCVRILCSNGAITRATYVGSITIRPISCFIFLDSAALLTLNDQHIFFKVGQSRSLFIYFRLFNTVDNKQVNYQKLKYKICQWLELNSGPLVSKANTLPTVPQPLPMINIFTSLIKSENTHHMGEYHWMADPLFDLFGLN